MKARVSLQDLPLAQGLFYLITGLWPLFSPRIFQKVTGPKVDFWLVNTVGLLIAVVGAVLGLAWKNHRVTPETTLLGAGSAASLGAIEIYYGLKRRIRPVYLLDAVVEAVLVLLWVLGFCKGRDNS